jgi:hypothetical protein
VVFVVLFVCINNFVAQCQYPLHISIEHNFLTKQHGYLNLSSHFGWSWPRFWASEVNCVIWEKLFSTFHLSCCDHCFREKPPSKHSQSKLIWKNFLQANRTLVHLVCCCCKCEIIWRNLAAFRNCSNSVEEKLKQFWI